MTDEEAVLKEVKKVADDVDQLYLDLCEFFREKVVPELCEHILKDYQEIEKTEGLTSEVQDEFVKHKLLVNSEVVH